MTETPAFISTKSPMLSTLGASSCHRSLVSVSGRKHSRFLLVLPEKKNHKFSSHQGDGFFFFWQVGSSELPVFLSSLSFSARLSMGSLAGQAEWSLNSEVRRPFHFRNSSVKQELGGWEETPWGKCLLCKTEDLSLNPTEPMESQMQENTPVTSSLL